MFGFHRDYLHCVTWTQASLRQTKISMRTLIPDYFVLNAPFLLRLKLFPFFTKVAVVTAIKYKQFHDIRISYNTLYIWPDILNRSWTLKVGHWYDMILTNIRYGVRSQNHLTISFSVFPLNWLYINQWQIRFSTYWCSSFL